MFHGQKQQADALESGYQMFGDINVHLLSMDPFVPYGEAFSLFNIDILHTWSLGVERKLILMIAEFLCESADTYGGLICDACGEHEKTLDSKEKVKEVIDQRLASFYSMTSLEDDTKQLSVKQGW